VKRALALAAGVALLLGACTHSRVVQRESGARPSAARTAPRPAVSPLPRNGIHVVRRGETLYGISFRYGLRYQDVAALNGIGDPFVIEIGQRLRLTPRAGALASTPRTTPTRPPVAQAPQPVTSRGSAPGLPVAAPPSAPIDTTGTPSWQWPTSGEVIGRYVGGDQTRQGIDIAGKAGQDVRAAAEGVVVYSGAGLVGYGELIIIKHSEEWLSAYAHNQSRLVGEGTRVASGQVIARMGRTGAPRDMLHFEVRRNGKPVDPLVQLPRR